MTKSNFTLGVIGSSTKPDEKRAPILPAHIPQIAPDLRRRIYFETGYGKNFNVTDATINEHVAGLMPRNEIFDHCDIVIIPKPTHLDLPLFRYGQTIWGWPHCVQDPVITQAAIDKKLTYITWESMNIWHNDTWLMHVFYKNNELAGYSSVSHALNLRGTTGFYSPPVKAAVINFGSTARGAVYALTALGYSDITVFTPNSPHKIPSLPPSIQFQQFDASIPPLTNITTKSGNTPLANVLAEFDIIVNCTLQNPNAPITFITNDQLHLLKPNALIVDISCDVNMAFDFARPTSFTDPTFTVGNNVTYYAVDHSPSYFWQSATYEISLALLPYIPIVMAGPDAQKANTTINCAIEIENGTILNPSILQFQNRSSQYPHAQLPA